MDYESKYIALVKAIEENSEDINAECLSGDCTGIVPIVRLQYIADEMELGA